MKASGNKAYNQWTKQHVLCSLGVCDEEEPCNWRMVLSTLRRSTKAVKGIVAKPFQKAEKESRCGPGGLESVHITPANSC